MPVTDEKTLRMTVIHPLFYESTVHQGASQNPTWCLGMLDFMFSA